MIVGFTQEVGLVDFVESVAGHIDPQIPRQGQHPQGFILGIDRC